ncbi:MAG: SDR family oxidoreductase [Acidobacteriota bacterium]|nr:SDR family oxidoreductase [Blastocatellia bacterium]MDW8167156.1 SDR family oxidoreductase [Acidobacteriota bacterium]
MSEPLSYAVLGATGGIGSELCRRLAAKGARLTIGGRNETKLTRLAEELGAHAIVVDATRSDQVERFFAEAIRINGPLSGVAHCVGSLLLKPAHLTSDIEWATTLDVNLTSAFFVVRAAARAMMQTGGSVVLVSSVVSRVGVAHHEAIAAAKAGLIGLTLSAAATYASRGIRFNCVAPGLVRTPLTDRLTSNESLLKASIAMHPLGRIGEPSDVAAAIEWLLDPAQSWITGMVIAVDGGLSAIRSRFV